jgi:hypothetical protein
MRLPLLLLLLLGFVAASGIFTSNPQQPTTALTDQVALALQIIVSLMIVMVVVAAAVYVGGMFFGAETRARATTWAHGMIAAVVLSAVMIAAVYVLLPGFFSGSISDFDIVQKIIELKNTAASVLAALIVVLLVLAGAVYAAGQIFGGATRAQAAGWANGLIAASIVAAVIYVLLSYILPQFESTFFSGTRLGLYGSVIIPIVFFVAFFILITYMLSKVFKVPEWEAYLSIELSNLMNSFLIVIFVFALFAVGEVVALMITGGGAASPPQAAIAYMQGTVADSALRATIDVYKINACTSILSTFSRRIGEFVLTQTYKVFPGIDTFVSITNVLGMTLLTLYNTAEVQAAILHVADAIMIPFILPAGLILRFFPPTRDAGAFLIALSFGFQFVFPVTYLINKQIYTDIGARPYNAPGEAPTILINSLCGPFKYGVAGYLFNPSANPIYGLIPGGSVIGNALSKIVSEGLLNAVSMAEFIPILRHIAALSLLALFMPALSMMVTIAFINAMTKFIVAKV